MARRGTPTATRADVAARRAKAVRLRRTGVGWDDIATMCGYSDKGAACKDVKRALDAYLKEQNAEVEQLRELELQHLDDLRRAAAQILVADHYHVARGVITDIPDPAPKLAAIDRLVRISDRRCAILGINAPTKVDATVTGQAEVDEQVQALIAQVEAAGAERVQQG